MVDKAAERQLGAHYTEEEQEEEEEEEEGLCEAIRIAIRIAIRLYQFALGTGCR